MKLDRLLSIVMLLINRDRVQAKELAEIFSVSVRTIYRDIEAINQAGIPIVTFQGANGGLGVMDSYRIDRNILCDDDIIAILRALRGLETSMANTKILQVIEKIACLAPSHKAAVIRKKSQQVVIDFSGWSHDDEQKEKIKLLEEASDQCKVVSFSYTSSMGEQTQRAVEPVQIYFKARNWYLYAFCQLRQEYRYFKLSRMADIKCLDLTFEPKPDQMKLDYWQHGEKLVPVELYLKFSPRARAKVIDWFPAQSIKYGDDGCIYTVAAFPEDEWVYSFILSFGSDVEVVQPQHVRDIIRKRAGEIAAIYHKKNETSLET